MINVLEVHNIEKRYKNISILKNLNMTIKKGAIYGLIGKNGSGKTSLLKHIYKKYTMNMLTVFSVLHSGNCATEMLPETLCKIHL